MKFLNVRQIVMGRQNRLRSLEVRVAGQDHAAMPLGGRDQSPLDFPQLRIDFADRVADPHFQIGHDLIVAAAARMQFSADIAEPFDEILFDVRMNVFEFERKCESSRVDFRTDFIQSRRNLFGFSRGNQPDFRQHPCVSLARNDVVAVEPLVERNRFGESFDAIIRAAFEPTTPRLLAHAKRPQFSVCSFQCAVRMTNHLCRICHSD